MAAYGYGTKTFVQALARLACRIVRYFTRHNAKLQANLSSANYACIQSAITCLQTLCNLLNKSAR